MRTLVSSLMPVRARSGCMSVQFTIHIYCAVHGMYVWKRWCVIRSRFCAKQSGISLCASQQQNCASKKFWSVMLAVAVSCISFHIHAADTHHRLSSSSRHIVRQNRERTAYSGCCVCISQPDRWRLIICVIITNCALEPSSCASIEQQISLPYSKELSQIIADLRFHIAIDKVLFSSIFKKVNIFIYFLSVAF